LNITGNPSLVDVNVNNNLLEILNTKNGAWSNGLTADLTENNLLCAMVDNIGYATDNWTYDAFTVFNTECAYQDPCAYPVGISDLTIPSKSLVRIFDVSLGRETTYKPNTLLIYLYEDGSAEKVYVVE
jgi:hypothetical protein